MEGETEIISCSAVVEEGGLVTSNQRDMSSSSSSSSSNNNSNNNNNNSNNNNNNNNNNNKMSVAPKLPEEAFNCICLLLATIILIVTYMLSPRSNTVGP